MTIGGVRSLVPIVLLAACSSAGPARKPDPVAPPAPAAPGAGTADERIRYYEERLAATPNLYPLHTLVGFAYLDKARQTHDPTWIGKAREAARRSLSIQDNFDAMTLMMTVEKYSHRFESAVSWAWRAADASTHGRALMDPQITAALVESYLGLGQPEEARRLLPEVGAPVDRFHLAAAMAQYLGAEKRVDEAVRYYLRARELARAEKGSEETVRWGSIMAAGVLLDNGRIGEARRYLDTAAREGWTPLLGIHQAELLEAEDRPAEALAAYEKVLDRDPDPEVRRKAYLLARRTGAEARAQAHFARAERELRRTLELGEVYALGALAQLYVDAEVKLEEALALAKRNLEWKRDEEARGTLREVERKLARGPVPARAP